METHRPKAVVFFNGMPILEMPTSNGILFIVATTTQ